MGNLFKTRAVVLTLNSTHTYRNLGKKNTGGKKSRRKDWGKNSALFSHKYTDVGLTCLTATPQHCLLCKSPLSLLPLYRFSLNFENVVFYIMIMDMDIVF